MYYNINQDKAEAGRVAWGLKNRRDLKVGID